MGMIESYMMQWENVAAGKDLELEADTGESILVKGVDAWANGLVKDFCEFKIGRMSIGYFSNAYAYANHLEQYNAAMNNGNLLTQMVAKGIMAGYPVAEGEKILIHNQLGAPKYSAIYYELYEAGDMTAEMPNGSKSKEFCFVNYGTNKEAMVANKYGEANLSNNPTEYPAFPFGADVPPKTEIDIHAILVLNFDPTGATPSTRDEVRSLRLTKDREVLWDKTRQGLYCTQGMSRLGWGCTQQAPVVKVEWLPKPMHFIAGEELKVEMSCGDTLIAAEELEMAFIETVRRVE